MTLPAVAANLVCPLLALGAVVAPLRERARVRLWLATAAAVASVYALTFADRHFRWWRSAGLDFSTHTGVAVVLALAIAFRAPRLRPALAVLVAGYEALIVVLGYHGVGDVITTVAVVVLVAWPVLRLAQGGVSAHT
jgi:hypothetical protein